MRIDSLGIGRHGVGWFVAGCLVALADLRTPCNLRNYLTITIAGVLTITPALSASLLVYLAVCFLSKQQEVAVRAAFLGVITALGIIILFSAELYKPLGLYIICLAWFHYSEYLFTAMCNPEQASTSSFMLNHSAGYHLAVFGSLLEFALESYLLPGISGSRIFMLPGFTLCLLGDILRKRAMWVAGTNFNHKVQHDLQQQDHKLITHDVYRIIQHPSYTGWMIFTIGTQVILLNPVCLVAFSFIMYRFFNERVKTEENALSRKHKEIYDTYSKITPRFLPRI